MIVYRVCSYGADNDMSIYGVMSTREKADTFKENLDRHYFLQSVPSDIRIEEDAVDAPYHCRCYRADHPHAIGVMPTRPE